MSKTYLVTFTPTEPYFFGNEKTFTYPGQKNSGQYGNKYFIKSEQIPSQSTLFGAVRYLLIPNKKHDYTYDKNELDNIIGADSFNIASATKQTFGVIEKISPVFLWDTLTGKRLIPTPKNHRNKHKEDEKYVDNTVYEPFKEYVPVVTANGTRLYAQDYISKHGLTESFVCPEDGTIYNNYDLFGSTIRIGINREKKDMFKKSFTVLKKGFAFAVFVTLKDSVQPPVSESVYLGQNKSLFRVNVTEQADNNEQMIKNLLCKGVPEDKHIVYCAGDLFADKHIYNQTVFAATTTKTYRAFTTNFGKVTKHSTLYNIISAGSIFIVDTDHLDTFKQVVSNENAEQIGFNNIIITD